MDPIGLRSVYDEAKRFAEALTMAYHRYHHLNTSIVRIFNTYGPRMRLDDGRVIPNFIQLALKKEPLTIYGKGTQTRSFCYVDDLINGIIALLLSNEHQPINMGNPQEISMKELSILINKLLKNNADIKYIPNMTTGDDPVRRQPDILKARQLLQWEPKISLEQGIILSLPYFKEKMGLK